MVSVEIFVYKNVHGTYHGHPLVMCYTLLWKSHVFKFRKSSYSSFLNWLCSFIFHNQGNQQKHVQDNGKSPSCIGYGENMGNIRGMVRVRHPQKKLANVLVWGSWTSFEKIFVGNSMHNIYVICWFFSTRTCSNPLRATTDFDLH